MHKNRITAIAAAVAIACGSASLNAVADMAAAERWVGDEFQPSTLSKADQMKEMEWFIKAAAPYKGMEINVVSETITTHEYEAKTLAKAFYEITGIKVNHDLIGEGDVVEKLQTQMQSGKNIYDAYINDSDLIGTHWRYQQVRNLTDWMAGEGKDVTDPMLDVDDFIGKSFTTGPDGKLYQLPDQQFANLYWFRHDWFTDPDIKAKFKNKYGYELGVPVNWSAYQDIADFFTNDVKEINGERVYGHMDYGKKDPSLGWRFTDAWLSMAGAGDKGEPNGLPVDEWGIRVDESSRPVGSASRGRRNQRTGRGLFSREIRRLAEEICAAECRRHGVFRGRPRTGTGQHRPADVLVHRLHRRHGQGRYPGRERGWLAQVAHGAVTTRCLLGGRPKTRLPGCRLVDTDEIHAGGSCQGGLAVCPVRCLQDCLAEEIHVGLTFIRESDINHQSFTDRAPKLGGA